MSDQENKAPMDTTQAAAMMEILHKIDTDVVELKGEMKIQLTDTNGKMKGHHELTEQKIKHLEKVSELQFKNVENEQVHLKERIDRAFIQSEEHYIAEGEINKKLPEIKEEITKEITETKRFNWSYVVGIVGVLTGVAAFLFRS